MQKSNVKAIILQTIYHSCGPMTVGSIVESTFMHRSTIKDSLVRLEIERCVTKKKFSDEGISPFDYKVSDKGRTPRYYYMLRYPLGLKKLQHFADIGLIELK